MSITKEQRQKYNLTRREQLRSQVEGDTPCKICGVNFKNQRGVNSHIRFMHKGWDIGTYYETFYPNYCIICGKLIKFKKEKYNQYKFCSKDCLKEAFKNNNQHLKGIRKYKEEFLLDELRRIHDKYKGTVPQNLFDKDSDLNHQILYKYFGSYTNACKLACIPYFEYEPRDDIKNEIPTITGLTVQIDTREIHPYKFEDFIIKKMDYGDYCLPELGSKVVIERKSIQDLKSTLSNYLRFERELRRARKDEGYIVILIDGTFEQFLKSKQYGKMSSKSIYHNLKYLSSQFADTCQFLFTGSRIKSAKLVYLLCVLTPDVLRPLSLQKLYDNNIMLDYLFDTDKLTKSQLKLGNSFMRKKEGRT